MKAKFLFVSYLSLALLVCSPVLAQSKAFFDFRGPNEQLKLVVDGQEYEPSFFGGFLSHKEAFKSQPEAYRLMEEAYENQIASNWVFWGLGIITPLTWLIGTSDSNLSPGLRSGVYWGSFLGGVFGGVYFQGLAGKGFLRAINTYNGVYETQKAAIRWEIAPVLGQEPGLALSLKF